MDIGELLRNKRIEKGLTQRDVADAVGVSEGTVSRWESGKIGNMRRDKIDSLAKVLAIDPVTIAKADSQKIISASTGAVVGSTIGGAIGATAAGGPGMTTLAALGGPIGLGAALAAVLSSSKKLAEIVDSNDDSAEIDVNNPPILVTREDEIKLVNQYRLLSDADKLAVRGLIDSLAQKYIQTTAADTADSPV